MVGFCARDRHDDDPPAVLKDRHDDTAPILDALQQAGVSLVLPKERKLDDVAPFRGAGVSR